jgi:hypothetical protein
MADLIPMAEDATWVPEIHQRPAGEPLTGGAPDLAADKGFANVPTQQLAKRTSWLKQKADTLLAYFSAGKLKASVLPSTAMQTDKVNTLESGGSIIAYTKAAGPAVVFGRSEIQQILIVGDATGNSLQSLSPTENPKTFKIDVSQDAGVTFASYSFRSDIAEIAVGGNPVWTAGNCPKFFGAAGYQKLQSGLILQWGGANSPDVVFPIAFPTAISGVYGTDQGNGASYLAVSAKSKTGATFESDQNDYTFAYFAIGY